MSFFARCAIPACLLLFVAACASTAGTRSGSATLRAGPPPPEYLQIGGADLRADKKIDVMVNTELLSGKDEQDSRLAVVFGFHFAAAASDAKTIGALTSSGGLKATDPIRLSPAGAADAELEDALNILAARAPDRDNIVGYLYRSPDRQYVVLIHFDTAAGANSLYFDVTNWANRAVDY
jgi:hypothetical protein